MTASLAAQFGTTYLQKLQTSLRISQDELTRAQHTLETLEHITPGDLPNVIAAVQRLSSLRGDNALLLTQLEVM